MRNAAVLAAWIVVTELLFWLTGDRWTGLLGWGIALASFGAGATVGRWWVLTLPVPIAIVTYIVAYLVVPECTPACPNTDGGRLTTVLGGVYLGTPFTILCMSAGLGARSIVRCVARGLGAARSRGA